MLEWPDKGIAKSVRIRKIVPQVYRVSERADTTPVLESGVYKRVALGYEGDIVNLCTRYQDQHY